MDDELARVFEAHVRYEVDRWRADAVRGTVAEEVGVVLGGLGTVALGTLVPVDRARSWARQVVVEEPLADQLLEEFEAVVQAVHGCLLAETGPASDALPRERYEQLVTDALGLSELRKEIIGQVTGSAVYAELVSHVLYYGLKNYLLTENAVVRNLPGASSLLRMGQNAVRSATPNLEAGIDRRLSAFVASNVLETVRDSHRFLEETLDDDLVRTIADEIWATNGSRPLGELATLVDPASRDAALATALEVGLEARSLPLVARVVDAVVDQFYEVHGEVPVATLLTKLGLPPERLTDAVTAVAAQLAAVALDGGHLEAYVRTRLEGFYAGYTG